MGLGKEFTKTISLGCTGDELNKAIKDSINVLGLKTKEGRSNDNEIHYLAVEKLSWMSTNWPVNYDITANKIEAGWRVIVKCWAKMTSITQDRHTEKKPIEFVDLIRDSGNLKTITERSEQSESNIDKLEKLAGLKEKGVITEEEFQQKKKDLLSGI